MGHGDANTSLYFGKAVGRGLNLLRTNLESARVDNIAIPTLEAQTPLFVYLAPIAGGKPLAS